ncbi:MAG TPA: M1 family metallopeptidase [Chakrabartia sp.]|nr:M1 family metallopeptidase [Chakrabartia sp.]
MKRIAMAAALALTCVSVPALAAGASQQAKPGLTTSQLPRTARPVHYTLSIVPDAAKLTFEGRATIQIDLLVPSDRITMNAADLAILSASIKASGGAESPALVTMDAKAETLTMRFEKTMPIGRYELVFAYTGRINQQANGLFALDYKDPQGADKRALFTQFEAPDARRMFPGWDEPSYKASYDLALTLPEGQMPVANTPVASQKKRADARIEYRFARTPVMSSYLVFLGGGEFDRITKMAGKTEVGLIMGRGNAEKARYALDASAQILPYFEEYFAQPFPLPKLDNVAGPGQSQFFSAMENWGAIFSFERVLLLDPALTSEAGRQRIYEVAAHEIAHQWFGDLVTMAWWNDLWLNEGFASWMAGKTMAHFNPDWEAELEDVADRETAMALDAYRTTHPIVQRVDTVAQASQAFDAITYSKGKAVISMLEGYAGAETWRTGLRSYMARHAYGNTTTADLWRAVEQAGAKGLIAIADDYTAKPGIPLVRVSDVACKDGNTRFTLAQGEFSLDEKALADRKPLRWQVPVRSRIVTADDAARLDVMAKPKLAATLDACGTLLVNAGQTGYFRTLYDAPGQAALRRDFAKLAPIDQLGVLADARALGQGGYQGMDVALNLIDAVPADANPRLLADAMGSVAGWHDLFEGDAATKAKIASWALARYAPVREKTGLAPRAGEAPPVALLRTDLIGDLGGMGDPVLVAEARRLFAALETDPTAMDGPLKSAWLGVLAAHADRATWDRMHAFAAKQTQQMTRSTWYRLLGGAKDPALAQAALDLALTAEPGPTLSAALIQEVAYSHPDLAVKFAIDHLEQVNQFVDGSSRTRYIAALAGAGRNPELVMVLEDYARRHLTPDSRKAVDTAQARIRARAAHDPRVKAEVKAWFEAK